MKIDRIDNVLEGTGVSHDWGSDDPHGEPTAGIDWPAYMGRERSIFPVLQEFFDKNPGVTVVFPHPYMCRFEGELRFDGIIDCNGAVLIWPENKVTIEGTGPKKSVIRDGVVEYEESLTKYLNEGNASGIGFYSLTPPAS